MPRLLDCCFILTANLLYSSPYSIQSQAAQLRSPVLTAIGIVNGKPWEPVIFDPPPTAMDQKLQKS